MRVETQSPGIIIRSWKLRTAGYAGSNNPKSYNGKENYDRFPDQIEDIPGYYHDLDFNKLNDHGGDDMTNDPRTQPANAKLVRSEIKISLLPGISPVSRARAIIIAIGVGVPNMINLIKNEPTPQEGRDYAPLDP